MSRSRKIAIVLCVWLWVFPILLVAFDDALAMMEPTPSPAASQGITYTAACQVVRAPRQWQECR